MSSSKTGVRGLIEDWVCRKNHDAYKIAVTIPKQVWIQAKVHPTLHQINEYLRVNKLREPDALKDNDFQTLRHRLFEELKDERGLKEYRALKRLILETKQFNFEQSVNQFTEFKSNTSVAYKHKSTLLTFWLPFFLGKGCKHPADFINWYKQAAVHVRTAKKLNSNEKYSANSWSNLTSTLNEYMKFLKYNGDITDNYFFTLKVSITTDDRKRGLTTKSRKRNAYTEEELIEIKAKIDARYSHPDDLKMKLRAYAIYLGPCTGIRRGNLLGLKAADLYPDAKVPHFVTRDNIVPGWSRGLEGYVVLESCTKSFVGTIKLPFIQPKKKILCEVARFIKEHVPPNEHILKCSPSTVRNWWSDIAFECDFKFLTPHDWKHSYATIGAMHLHDWYKGNPYFLQTCCLHEKYETTLKYINQVSDNFLKAFEE